MTFTWKDIGKVCMRRSPSARVQPADFVDFSCFCYESGGFKVGALCLMMPLDTFQLGVLISQV